VVRCYEGYEVLCAAMRCYLLQVVYGSVVFVDAARPIMYCASGTCTGSVKVMSPFQL
jgi:hypothetical protein